MGKGKSSFAKRVSAKTKKPEPKLDVEFNCLFCNDLKSASCRIPKIKSTTESSIGLAQCVSCNASFSTKTTHLTKPIDVYSEWLDECVRVNRCYQECQDFDQFDEDEEEDVKPFAKKQKYYYL